MEKICTRDMMLGGETVTDTQPDSSLQREEEKTNNSHCRPSINPN